MNSLSGIVFSVMLLFAGVFASTANAQSPECPGGWNSVSIGTSVIYGYGSALTCEDARTSASATFKNSQVFFGRSCATACGNNPFQTVYGAITMQPVIGCQGCGAYWCATRTAPASCCCYITGSPTPSPAPTSSSSPTPTP